MKSSVNTAVYIKLTNESKWHGQTLNYISLSIVTKFGDYLRIQKLREQTRNIELRKSSI